MKFEIRRLHEDEPLARALAAHFRSEHGAVSFAESPLAPCEVVDLDAHPLKRHIAFTTFENAVRIAAALARERAAQAPVE